MTRNRTLSRSLAALTAIMTLAGGVALTAAPSTARAKTATPMAMSSGIAACPACDLLKLYNQNGLSFRDVVADVQDGELVMTAQVILTGTAGKPRTGSVVFSVLVDSDGAGFMDYTDDVCMPSLMSPQAGAQACGAISGALRDAAASGMGIIMRDGGICDPIRHMGC
jgi:hypothetical protein